MLRARSPPQHAHPTLPTELQIFAHAQFDPEEYVNAVCRESSAGSQIRQKLEELISLQAVAKARLLRGAQEQTGTYIAATNKIRATARELNALVRQLEHFGQGLADLDEALARSLGEDAQPRIPFVRSLPSATANGFDKRRREDAHATTQGGGGSVDAAESRGARQHDTLACATEAARRDELGGGREQVNRPPQVSTRRIAANDVDQGVRQSTNDSAKSGRPQPQRQALAAEEGPLRQEAHPSRLDESGLLQQNSTSGETVPDSAQDQALSERQAVDKPSRTLLGSGRRAATTATGDDRTKKNQARSPPRGQAHWHNDDKSAVSEDHNRASTGAQTVAMEETDDDCRSIEQEAVDTIDHHARQGHLGLAVAQWLRLSRDLRKKKKSLDRDAIEELAAELEARREPLATAVEAATLLDRDALRLFGLCRGLREAARRESMCDDKVPTSARLVLGDALEVQRNLRAKDAMLHVLGRKHHLEARFNHLQPCLDALRKSDPSRFWDGLALALEDTFQLFKSSDRKKAAKLATALIDFAKTNLNKFVVDIADELLADVAHLTDKRTALASTARLTRLIKAGSKVLDATAAASSWPPALAARPLLLDILAPKIANALAPSLDIAPTALHAALGDAQLADSVVAIRTKRSQLDKLL